MKRNTFADCEHCPRLAAFCVTLFTSDVLHVFVSLRGEKDLHILLLIDTTVVSIS